MVVLLIILLPLLSVDKMAVSSDHMRRSSHVHVLLEARCSCFLMFGEEFCLRKIRLVRVGY